MRAMILGCLCGLILMPFVSKLARGQECDKTFQPCVKWDCRDLIGTTTTAVLCPTVGNVTYYRTSCAQDTVEEARVPGQYESRNRRVAPLRNLCKKLPGGAGGKEWFTLQCGDLMGATVPGGPCGTLVGSCSGDHVEPC